MTPWVRTTQPDAIRAHFDTDREALHALAARLTQPGVFLHVQHPSAELGGGVDIYIVTEETE